MNEGRQQLSTICRMVLLAAAFGWGISILCVFLPWSITVIGLEGLGSGPVPDDPMLNYWSRMACGAFTIIGTIYAAILIAPHKYAVIIPLMAWLTIGEGIILLVSGLRLDLPPFPFWCDTAFCLAIGILLLILKSKNNIYK